MEIKLNTEIERAMSDAINIAEHSHHEYLTPEHLLLSMLRTTSLSITEIADRLHFADTPSFSKFFSRLKGMSPKEYRKG